MLADMDTSAERIAFIRKAMGLTQDEFTEALNEVLKASGQPPVTRGAVGNWEREGGTGLAMRNLQALSELSGATIDWLANNRGSKPREDLLRKIGEELIGASPTVAPAEFPLTVEVVAQAAGSTLGKGATILFDQPRIGWLPMLPGLRGLEGIYGLEVTGDSMVPMFKPGKPVYVSPHSPVRKDDPIIVIEHKSSNGNAVGFIKIMVADRKDRVITRQLNPPLEISFMKAPGLTIHRVLELDDLIDYPSFAGVGDPNTPPRVRRGPKR
jgi:phage repressor protein C with HTH and peptisase S24 domain